MNKTVFHAVMIGFQSYGIPMFVIGKPGGGKTSIFTRAIESLVGKDLTWAFAPSSMQPPDIGGWPRQTPEGVELLPLKRAYQLSLGMIGDTPAGLVIDEFAEAPQMYAPLQRLLNEHMVGDCMLGSRVGIVATMNPQACSTSGRRLTAPISNRVCHIQMEAELDPWGRAMLRNWEVPEFPKVPSSWADGLMSVRSQVYSFLKRRPDLFDAMPDDVAKRAEPYPSPRTWDRASTLLTLAASVKASEDVEALLLGGMVGAGTAVEYLNWRRKLDLPDPELALKNPATWKLPADLDQVYAALMGIVGAVAAKPTPTRWRAGMSIVCGEHASAPDAAASCAAQLLGMQPKGTEIPPEILKLGEFLRALQRG